jgi:UDP-N-acetylglucosamine 4-epimerase
MINFKKNRWLITGVAGFIGSNLLEYLLLNNQQVIGLDNFSTGNIENINEVLDICTPEQKGNFQFINGDIRDYKSCLHACSEIDYVLHQAALGSVSRSIELPMDTYENNVTGFINILDASNNCNVKKFIYASSSSVYGDLESSPKYENKLGELLSPYATSKYANEIYARIYQNTYNLKTIGLRYFNVFGKRQDPLGPYAAVIPRWIAALKNNVPIEINGDGQTSRDFCYIDNVVQANILAALNEGPTEAKVLNIAYGQRTTLNQLYEYLIDIIKPDHPVKLYKEFRRGDIRHSLANIDLAIKEIGYSPRFNVRDGLQEAIKWYLK